MIVKFLKHGQGSASKAMAYLLGEKDHLGVKRHEIRVLWGDPALTATVADGLRYKSKYKSAVIAWAPEDSPTDSQIDEVLQGFSKVAFAGMEDRVTWSAVLHRENGGGVHVHIISANCDLESGRSFNPAPPGWEVEFGAWKRYENYRFGWLDPDSRKRGVQPGFSAYVVARELRAGVRGSADPRAELAEFLGNEIQQGRVENRNDVLRSLRDCGFAISRRGKDYVSIVDPENGKKMRLKGAMFEEDFDAKTWKRPVEASKINLQEAEKARVRMESEIQKREEYNRKRYKIGEKSNREGANHDRKSVSSSVRKSPRAFEVQKLSEVGSLHDGKRGIESLLLVYAPASVRFVSTCPTLGVQPARRESTGASLGAGAGSDSITGAIPGSGGVENDQFGDEVAGRIRKIESGWAESRHFVGKVFGNAKQFVLGLRKVIEDVESRSRRLLEKAGNTRETCRKLTEKLTEVEKMRIEIDKESYEKGFKDGKDGKYEPEGVTDSFGYHSGQVEGAAEREKSMPESDPAGDEAEPDHGVGF